MQRRSFLKGLGAAFSGLILPAHLLAEEEHKRKSFRIGFGEARGLIFADSHFINPGEYRPACRVSPCYSNESRFQPLVDPDFKAMAAGVKEDEYWEHEDSCWGFYGLDQSWKEFIGVS